MFKVFNFIKNFPFRQDIATFINVIFVFKNCLVLDLLSNPQDRNLRAESVFLKKLGRLSAKLTKCLAKTKYNHCIGWKT